MNDQQLVTAIEQAADSIKEVVQYTPLEFSKRLSNLYKAKVFIKREDLQEVRSYKIRGAFNLMNSLTPEERKKGVVCASAGNHAQGVAFSANRLQIKATIFMPTVTPLQKINKVKSFGGEYVDVRLVGLTFDDSYKEAVIFGNEEKAVFIHPFDDYHIIAGQGTVGKEIVEQLDGEVDVVVCPIGGGGLISGVATFLKAKNEKIKVIGVEPSGATSMVESLKKGSMVTLESIDTFVDGAAVKTVGKKTFEITKKLVDAIEVVPEGKVCVTMIELYQNEGIVAEPAGALSLAALDLIKDQIEGKTVVCVLSGGNNDILRYPEILEKSLVYQGLKHYFLINFAQKPGQLKKFVSEALGPTDDIVRFEYIKKTSKELGPALVGIELTKKADLEPLLKRMEELQIDYTIITSSDLLYSYLI